MKTISGIAASYGISIGPAYIFTQDALKVERWQIDDRAHEWKRFTAAQVEAQAQLDEVYQKALTESGAAQAEIFKAQSLMLNDPELNSAVKKAVDETDVNVEFALSEAAEVFCRSLEALDDAYLKARALDIRDVTARMLRILMHISQAPEEKLNVPSIIAARDLTPSDTVLLNKEFVLGFCTELGGATSHTAILARGLGIPAVVGVKDLLQKTDDGSTLILDGDSGQIIIDPYQETVQEFNQRQQNFERKRNITAAAAHKPAITKDGHQVEIAANIGSADDAQQALDSGAEGIGLLRSEFLFLERASLPSEEEQYKSYKTAADAFGSKPVILRTLDVGGDKEIPYINMPPEPNPFLGLRAVRLCLTRPELFKPQLRAALRAGVGNNLKLMFPMVASVSEVRQVRKLLEECREELKAEGLPTADLMEVGIMIEIPSAAIMADQLAQEVDFFSIGTNDLSQYTLAADRTNASVAEIASGFQPAVFRLIKQVIDAAHSHGKWVGLCGELAGELIAVPILLGLGLDELSMNPPAVPYVKYLIRSISMKQAKKSALEVLNLSTAEEIKRYVVGEFPEVLIT